MSTGNPDLSSEDKLRKAAQLIKAGLIMEARRLLREVLAIDTDNLLGWELLARTSLTTEEEAYCLKRILGFHPTHPWAGQWLAAISPTGQSIPTPAVPKAGAVTPRSRPRPAHTTLKLSKKRDARRNRLVAGVILLLAAMCIGLSAITITRAGVLNSVAPAARRATVIARLGRSTLIANPNDSNSPSNFPSPDPFTGVVTRQQIANGSASTLTLVFQNNLSSGSGYSITVTFDNGCSVSK